MTEAYMQLVDRLGHIKSNWCLRRLVEGEVVALTVAAAVLLLMTGVDHALAMGTLGRVTAAVVLYGTMAAMLWHAVGPLRISHTDDYFASMIELRSPSAKNRIINALQLGRTPQPAVARLIEAIVSQGAEAMDAIDASAVVGSPLLKRAAAGLGCVAAIGLLYAALSGPAMAASTMRVLLPFASISPFTYTTLKVTPDQPQRLLEGSPLTITAVASQRNGERGPDHATLQWSDAMGRSRRLEMKTAADGSFSYTFPAVDASMSLIVLCGDAASAKLPITVDPRPRIDAMSVTYHLPAYTAAEDETIKDFDGHIQALAGTVANLTVKTNKDLQTLALSLKGAAPLEMKAGVNTRTWSIALPITAAGSYHLKMLDVQGYEVDAPATYTIALLRDEPPGIAITHPGRDLSIPPEASITFEIAAQDRYGLGPVRLLGKKVENAAPKVLAEWANDGAKPPRQVTLALTRSVKELGLQPGDHLQYWATAEDRNPGTAEAPGPGRAQTRVFHLIVLNAAQAQQVLGQQLGDFATAIREVIKLQRQNRGETATMLAATGLVDRQGLIIRRTQLVADVMQKSAFPGQTIIDELRDLAADPMAKVLSDLEGYRDSTQHETGKQLAAASLPLQDKIVERLEAILLRLDRDDLVAHKLKKMEQDNAPAAKQVTAKLQQLSKDLDKFLTDMKDIDEKYEKMPKRKSDETSAEELKALADIEHRLDRWKEWTKGTVDELAKLPEGFSKDSSLADTMKPIFEEIEKKKKPPTQEIATPAEENGKATATKIAEDLELWLADKGDSTKWVMEDHPEGKTAASIPELPEKLQDLVGDLIEELEEFDKDADDKTSTSSFAGQAGWDVTDGPMSSFGANGKTGNQLPNDSELTGRSGAGRRGKASGQMVGDSNPALDGRPTPARTTNEKYEAGDVKSKKQLDPRGATGGGKKTGEGERGLQGGTPPDFTREHERLDALHKTMREKMQEIAHMTQANGKSSQHVDRALELMTSAEQDAKDHRYDDATRKRKTAIGELRADQSHIDQAVELSLRKAPNLPADMRKQISAASGQALPEGYEDLVGEYYKALSTAGNPTPAGSPK